MRTFLRRLPTLLLIASLSGCASLASGTREPFATIIVENDSTMTVNIYVLRQGARLRLGQVTGLSQKEFPLRRGMISGARQLQLMVDPVGSLQNHPSQSLYISEGDVIELRVSSFIR